MDLDRGTLYDATMSDDTPLAPLGAFDLRMGDCKTLLGDMPAEAVDLTITSPPYFIGKEYDASRSLSDFISLHEVVLPSVAKATKKGGSICWQVGYHVQDQTIEPLDFIVHNLVKDLLPEWKLRNRIVWHFGHGLHAKRRFSARHEVVLWYTHGDEYTFDLEAVRVSQKYPGKRSYKGSAKGEFSGNPNGKNPEDVWDIPNIKAGHVEKTEHPCQFPVALASRLIRALTPAGGTVLDPFMGSGTTGVAAIVEGRKFIGIEANAEYLEIARQRCAGAVAGETRIRDDYPTLKPDTRSAVATRPGHFKDHAVTFRQIAGE